jgi:ABC-type multidrug transport system ATPase subunit
MVEFEVEFEQNATGASARPSMMEKKRSAQSVRDIIKGAKNASGGGSAMQDAVFEFKNLHFTAGKGDKLKKIITNVTHTIKSGECVAMMGPSGAGKTSLLRVLTLDAHFGTPYGEVTLNGVPMSAEVFNQHCYIVQQVDKHWPYITVRESLSFAAQLYNAAAGNDLTAVVDGVLGSMGLESCADDRCSGLSGGQKRRLSIGIALLKQPAVLFLDEPTSGLDSASSTAVAAEMQRVAQDEGVIVVCTIHQPSTKVYNGFDQVMILSRGREAFTGRLNEAVGYFESIGYPLPPATNPAEHFLDIVNSDFSDEDEVRGILDKWQTRKAEFSEDIGQIEQGISESEKCNLVKEVKIVLRRQMLLVSRDPVLYIGRALIFAVGTFVFGLVYKNSRDDVQAQSQNKFWCNVWFIGMPSNMGLVAVYALNDEFKSLLLEVKNGMISPQSYLLSKFIMVIPIMFIFGTISLLIPGFVIASFPFSAFGLVLILWSCCFYAYESAAEAFAVLSDDVIFGMLNYLSFWFAGFLFGGFLVPEQDLFWPFKFFYYVMPLGYYVRSSTYLIFRDITWDTCSDFTTQPVCSESSDGDAVLDAFGRIYPLISSDNQVAKDIIILIAIAAFWKLVYFFTAISVSKKTTKISGAIPESLSQNALVETESAKEEET